MSTPHCYPPSHAIHDDSYRFVLFPLGGPPFHLIPPCRLYIPILSGSLTAPIPNLYAISKFPQLANGMTPQLHFSLVSPPWNLYHWVIPTGHATYTYHIMKPEGLFPTVPRTHRITPPPIATLFVYTLHPGDLPSSNTAASAQFT